MTECPRQHSSAVNVAIVHVRHEKKKKKATSAELVKDILFTPLTKFAIHAAGRNVCDWNGLIFSSEIRLKKNFILIVLFSRFQDLKITFRQLSPHPLGDWFDSSASDSSTSFHKSWKAAARRWNCMDRTRWATIGPVQELRTADGRSGWSSSLWQTGKISHLLRVFCCWCCCCCCHLQIAAVSWGKGED